jgi:hypothetical protein
MPLFLLRVGSELCLQNGMGMPPALECTLLGRGMLCHKTWEGVAPGRTGGLGEISSLRACEMPGMCRLEGQSERSAPAGLPWGRGVRATGRTVWGLTRTLWCAPS